jgi:arylsulfate sulfotransferase
MKYVFNLSILFLALLFEGCSSFIIDDPEVSFYQGNVLLPTIKFETKETVPVYIEYWPEHFPHKLQRSKTSESAHHSITLFNVTQLTKYNFVIYTADKQKSDVLSFTTGEVPERAFKVSKDLIDTTQFNGFLLVRRLYKSGADAIINNKGEIVWYHLYDTIVRRAFTWTDHQSILSIYDSAQIVEIDLLGNRILDLKLEQLKVDNKLHHEILYNSKQQIVALTLDSAEVDLQKFGGKKKQNLRADGIIVLNNKGEKIWDWNLLQKTNPLAFDIGPFNLKESWGHANSFAIADDGNYVVSFRDFSQVWKINSIDGSIMWKLGKNGDFEIDSDSYFIWQHSVYFNKRGELMMFDNGSKAARPNSRVLSFTLDEKNMKAKTIVNVELPLELSAYRMCSAELIEEGKYLVCTTRKGGTLSVVNDRGDILWKVSLSTPSYRAYYLYNPFDQFKGE